MMLYQICFKHELLEYLFSVQIMKEGLATFIIVSFQNA